jgi:hypothetical protein
LDYSGRAKDIFRIMFACGKGLFENRVKGRVLFE